MYFGTLHSFMFQTHSVFCVHTEAPEEGLACMRTSPVKLEASSTVEVLVQPPHPLLNPEKWCRNDKVDFLQHVVLVCWAEIFA